MQTATFYALELRDTRERRMLDQRITTFFYRGLYDGFAIDIEKAMRFDTSTEAFRFRDEHKLFGFVVIEAPAEAGEPFFKMLDKIDAIITQGESQCAIL